MNEVISVVMQGSTKYTLHKNRAVLVEPGDKAFSHVLRIENMGCSVQQLFEEDLSRKAKKARDIAESRIAEAFADDQDEDPEPSLEAQAHLVRELKDRITKLEWLLTEAKAPFAFVKDKTLYDRINSAIGV